jgi:hypothetical protein
MAKPRTPTPAVVDDDKASVEVVDDGLDADDSPQVQELKRIAAQHIRAIKSSLPRGTRILIVLSQDDAEQKGDTALAMHGDIGLQQLVENAIESFIATSALVKERG